MAFDEQLAARIRKQLGKKKSLVEHTRIFDLSGGRPMKGWILVESKGLEGDVSLATWVGTGVKFAESLPAK
jgi:hypothetical protein